MTDRNAQKCLLKFEVRPNLSSLTKGRVRFGQFGMLMKRRIADGPALCLAEEHTIIFGPFGHNRQMSILVPFKYVPDATESLFVETLGKFDTALCYCFLYNLKICPIREGC